ncbi:MAG: TIM barrel protein [Planctomycetes bacterium]|nr:TIM barrel protein [Planctomycetota bacterium]
MKVGIQSILCGTSIHDLDEFVDTVADLGFHGIEFSQIPSKLPPLQTLLARLARRNLALIGLAGGGLTARMEYLGGYRDCYLYVDEDDEEPLKQALAAGFTLAVHPHLHKRISRVWDAEQLFEAHPDRAAQLKFLPDTAHLYIAGHDPVRAIRDHLGRLAGVHLKDWTPLYGWSYHRYARGFTELGKGDVPLADVVRLVAEDGRCPWLVTELDATTGTVSDSLVQTVRWLAREGLLPEPPAAVPSHHPGRARNGDPVVELDLVWTFFRIAQCPPTEFYRQAATGFVRHVPGCEGAVIAGCNREHGFVTVLGAYPEELSPGARTVAWYESYSRHAVESQSVRRFGGPEEPPLPSHPAFDADPARGYRSLVSIPVLNTWNPHHVRFVVNLFSRGGPTELPDEFLHRLAREFGIAADIMLDGWCNAAAGRVAGMAQDSDTVAGFVGEVRKLVRELTGCREASLFLVNEARDRLVPAPGSPVTWGSDSSHYYLRGQGLTGRTWARNQAILTLDPARESGWRGLSTDGDPSERASPGLFTPVRTTHNRVYGVIRCAGRGGPAPVTFTDDDVAVLDSVSQGVVPHLMVLRHREAVDARITRVIHELANPVTAIRSAIAFLERDLSAQIDLRSALKKDYLGDVLSWCGLMQRLLKNCEIIGTEGPLPLALAPTLLHRDVVAPAVRQCHQVLRGRKFDPAGIEYNGFIGLPSLTVDRGAFQQVFFNLLSNSIKYAYNDPSAFSVEISAERSTRGDVLIRFRDWGIGIPEPLAERIFEEGFRGPHVVAFYSGQGIGLAVARKAIEAHGGTIRVTQHRYPTEFTIWLPASLQTAGTRGT